MDYLTVSELRELVKTDLPDDTLQRVIRRESAAITRRLRGEPGDPRIDECRGGGPAVWLTFPPASIVQVTEAGEAVAPELYRADGRLLLRLGGVWADPVVVTYTIKDRQDLLDLCARVCLELCRLTLAETGKAAESLGDYRYESKDQAAERRKLLAQLPVAPRVMYL